MSKDRRLGDRHGATGMRSDVVFAILSNRQATGAARLHSPAHWSAMRPCYGAKALCCCRKTVPF
jgi:hypothetical protein